MIKILNCADYNICAIKNVATNIIFVACRKIYIQIHNNHTYINRLRIILWHKIFQFFKINSINFIRTHEKINSQFTGSSSGCI